MCELRAKTDPVASDLRQPALGFRTGWRPDLASGPPRGRLPDPRRFSEARETGKSALGKNAPIGRWAMRDFLSASEAGRRNVVDVDGQLRGRFPAVKIDGLQAGSRPHCGPSRREQETVRG